MHQKIYSRFLQLMILFNTMLIADDYIVKADSIFNSRIDHFDVEKVLADSTTVNRAIRLYQKSLTANRLKEEKYEAIWKLLQAYYFKGNFTTDNMEEKQRIFARGVEIGEHHIKTYSESVEIHCWLGILWGYLGEVYSSFTAARKGVPGKVKYYAEKTIELDDHYLDAGGYRMLGRLHFMVPKIPLLMGWPSKEKSMQLLKKACAIAPKNLLNKLYLAEVLYEENDKNQARLILENVIHTREIIHDIIIDTWVKNEAGRLLHKFFPEEEKKPSS
jgi:tetratricopeptide (TPR) repeat protein